MVWKSYLSGDYMASLDLILFIIPVIITLQIGIFVLFAGKRHYLNRVFFLLSVLIVLWHIEGLSTNLDMPWRQLVNIGGIFLPVAFFQFSLALMRESTAGTRATIFFGYLWAVVLVLNGFSPLLVIKEYLQYGFTGPQGKGIFLYLGYFLSYTILAELLLLRKARENYGEATFLRYLLVAVAALAAILSGTLLAGSFSSPGLYWLSPVFNMVYVFVMGWAIWRYEALQVGSLLRTTSVYSGVLALVFTAYLIVVQLVSTITTQYLNLGLLWAGLLATLIIGPLFYPLRKSLDAILKNYFPLPQDLYYDKLRIFSGELANLIPIEEVSAKILTFITEVFAIKHAELVVFNPSRQLRSWRVTHNPEVKITEGNFQNPGVCTYGIERIITVPLHSRDNTVGWLKLGESTRGQLSTDEVDLIKSFVDQAGTALHNALLFSELTALTQHYEAVLAGSVEGIIVVDERLRIVTINSVAAKMFDAIPEQVTNRYLPELSGALGLEQMISRLKQSKKPISNVECQVGPVENRIPVELTVSFTQHEDDDTPPSILLVLADLSERKKVEEQLRRTERLAAMGRLTAGLAHELRNGLNKIGGFAAILEDVLADQPELAYYSNSIQEDVQGLADFLNKFLTFAREREYDLSRVLVVQVIKNTLETLRTEATKLGVRIVEDYQADPCVPGDRHQLGMAFFNLIINAIQALMEEGGGTLTVRVEQSAQYCLINIEDDGPGIPVEKQEAVFDPFYTTKEAGTGLGLPTTYKIIRGHNGTLRLSSTLGQGTTFSIELPLCTSDTLGKEEL